MTKTKRGYFWSNKKKNIYIKIFFLNFIFILAVLSWPPSRWVHPLGNTKTIVIGPNIWLDKKQSVHRSDNNKERKQWPQLEVTSITSITTSVCGWTLTRLHTHRRQCLAHQRCHDQLIITLLFNFGEMEPNERHVMFTGSQGCVLSVCSANVCVCVFRGKPPCVTAQQLFDQSKPRLRGGAQEFLTSCIASHKVRHSSLCTRTHTHTLGWWGFTARSKHFIKNAENTCRTKSPVKTFFFFISRTNYLFPFVFTVNRKFTHALRFLHCRVAVHHDVHSNSDRIFSSTFHQNHNKVISFLRALCFDFFTSYIYLHSSTRS